MKFVLAPFGSRGDVEPVLALGRRLVDRGHKVVVCAPVNFRDAVEALDLPFHSAGADFRRIFEGARSNAALVRAALAETPAQFHALLEASRGADLILGVALQFAAPTVAALLGVQYRYAVLSPMYLRSVSLPPFALRGRPVPAFMHRLFWRLEDASARGVEWLNSERRALGLRQVKSLHRYLLGDRPLGAFDPVLSPLPDDAIPAEVTGYWRQEVAGALPAKVSTFLANGRAPIYLSFGSVSSSESAARLQSLTRAMLASGRRIIVGKGWTEISDRLDARDCMVVDDVPHDLLLPHASMAIHHGGAGTTIAAALAAVPQIIVPHLGDQDYHGRRVAQLQLGPAPIHLDRLTPEGLVAAVSRVEDEPLYAQRAREFAGPLRAREGAGIAADLLVSNRVR